MLSAATTLALSFLAAPPVEAVQPLDVIVRRHGEAFIADQPSRAVIIGVSTPAGRRFWGFGGIDRDGQRITPDERTLYEIGSITKTLTGTLLADVVRDGVLSLDDPVRDHLPSDWSFPSADDREISFLHLATHTSSLPRLPPGFTGHLLITLTPNDPYAAFREENLRITLEQIHLDRPVGSRYEYSNLGAGLLGWSLARATRANDVDSLFRDRLLDPLSLSDTTFTPTDEQLARLAPPFQADGDPDHVWHFDCLKACGGLRSTADDMLAYAEAAIGRTPSPLLPAFQLAMRPFRQTCEGERSIGLGWMTQPMTLPEGVPRLPATRLVWHGGATGGYRAFLGLMPERGLAIVVLSNSTATIDPDLTWPVMNSLLRQQ